MIAIHSIWTCMLFLFPSSWLLNPRRSAAWRTQWQLWGRTMKGLLAPTLFPRRICRRTWSLPNTSFCECRSSCHWQRRYITVVFTCNLQLQAPEIDPHHISNVINLLYCPLIVCMCVHGVQELDKKFQQTAAYRNMKEILTKKNEQIKEIRKRLQRWVFIFNSKTTQVSSSPLPLLEGNGCLKNTI